ncbi:hypothetical protein [Caballeronia calidae]|uniref:hypothetical protein n=1 Tax=Caballeronia calidae TaxID=1777139 RepID=UPI0012FDE147|nr:hypothetical protein [Caballeronia calidae]
MLDSLNRSVGTRGVSSALMRRKEESEYVKTAMADRIAGLILTLLGAAVFGLAGYGLLKGVLSLLLLLHGEYWKRTTVEASRGRSALGYGFECSSRIDGQDPSSCSAAVLNCSNTFL